MKVYREQSCFISLLVVVLFSPHHVQSESSGAVTTDGSPSMMDTSSSTCLSITGDIPYQFPPQRKQKGAASDSILTFAQKKPSSGASKGMEFSGRMPSNRIEVL